MNHPETFKDVYSRVTEHIIADVCLLAPIDDYPRSPELFHHLPADYETTRRPSPPSIHAEIQHAPRYQNHLLYP
jgi:hypothetical protein